MSPSTPATAPMSTAAHGATNAHGAVIATRPESMPLHIIDGSGLPKRIHRYTADATAPAPPASMVFTRDHADAVAGAGQGAAGVEPEPAEGQDERAGDDHRDVVAEDRARVAVFVVLADARARSSTRVTSDITPPCMWTTEEPAKSTAP